MKIECTQAVVSIPEISDDETMARRKSQVKFHRLIYAGAVAATIVIIVGAFLVPFLDRAEKLSLAVAGLLTLITLLVAAIGGRNTGSDSSATPSVLLNEACVALAGQVRQQWAREAGMRGLLCGDVTRIAETWQALPTKQLVIIGSAGSGKTSLAVLLVHGLLAQWLPGDLIPVLVSMSGWEPHREHPDTWLARTLIEQYPLLADQDRFGPDAAMRLIDQERVFPILDGLDEMPEPLRQAAVEALTVATGVDRPLVVTCRAQEYHDTITRSGTPLARASVIELEPIAGKQAAAYLLAGAIGGRDRWDPVIEVLKTCPQGALAKALATPLMVYLTRTAYAPPGSDPAEVTRFASPNDIESYLLAAYLPVVYGSRLPVRQQDAHLSFRDYSPSQAQRWLTFLAHHLHRTGSRGLVWWQLAYAVPRANLVLGFVGGLACGLVTALVTGFVAMLLFSANVGLLASLGAGLAGGVLGGFAIGTRMEEVLSPHHLTLRPKILIVSILFGLVVGILDGLIIQPVNGVVLGIMSALSAGLVGGLTRPATPQDTVDSRQILRTDRTVAIAVRLIIGLIGGVFAGIAFGATVTVTSGIVAGVAFVFVFIFFIGLLGEGPGNAWIRFEIARCWLGAHGQLPWALMSFFEDAYRRGVLRRVGAEYQFRHARLQDYLAEQ